MYKLYQICHNSNCVKRKIHQLNKETNMTKNQYAHQRGKINDSAVKALVTDPLFRTRVERNKKGKGSYQRHEKHKGANRGESPFKINRLF